MTQSIERTHELVSTPLVIALCGRNALHDERYARGRQVGCQLELASPARSGERHDRGNGRAGDDESCESTRSFSRLMSTGRLTGSSGHDRRSTKRRLLADDLRRQLLQICAWLEPEVVVESAPCLFVDLESFRVPTRAIEREHELSDELLPVRILGDERLKLSDGLLVPAERELRVDAQLESP